MQYILSNADTFIELGAWALSVIFFFLTTYFRSSKKLQALAGRVINDAEQAFKGTSHRGQDNFNYALTMLYDKVPVALRPFITRQLLGEMLQSAFDELSAFATKQLDGAVEQAEIILYGSEEGRE